MVDPVVKLQNGSARGVVEKHEEGFNYYAFKGIPYAEPPLGDLRFKNLWIPNELKPVIVSMHGGSYQFSSGSDVYHGAEYLIRKDIVLVTFNYRVGVLGFLNLEDKIAPGNQGLKDQVIVLQWVQENIQAFSGDPNNVTIYGAFTGASCAYAVSPLTKGLFHKVISQGCCVYNTWVYITDAKATAMKFCSILGKELLDSEEILKLLKTVDTKLLLEAQNKLRKVVGALLFGPGIYSNSDNPFMPVHPVTTADEGVHLPYLIGYPNRPGLILLLGTTNQGTCNAYFNDQMNLVFHRYQDKKAWIWDQNFKLIFKYNTKEILDHYNLNAEQIRRLYYKARVFEKMGIEYLKKGSKGYRLMEQMTEMWANFATYGRPTIETSELIPVHWEPISNGTLLRYLSIDEDLTMKSCVNVDKKLLSAKSISV